MRGLVALALLALLSACQAPPAEMTDAEIAQIEAEVTAAVKRGAPKAFVMGDMPFMSYQVGPEQALTNAGRFVKEAGAGAVKLEGGRRRVPVIRALIGAGG